MITKEHILQYLQKAFKTRRAVYEKRMTHPVRDWLIGLALFLLVVLLGGTQTAIMFVTYRNINTDGGTYEEALPRYNALLVENMLKKYEARKDAYGIHGQTEVVVTPEAVPVQSTSTAIATTTEEVDTEIETGEEEGVIMSN
jgi:hypothetical protein